MSTRARVHRRDELEAGRQDQRAPDPDDRHAALLEGLTQRFEDVPPEFGQLVEEEDALVGAGDLARRQDRAAANHPGVGDRVVWRTSLNDSDRPLAGLR
jgi:hypothetical protein